MPSITLRAHVLDPVEQSLYRALTLVICQRALLFAKINLSDLFSVPSSNKASSDLVQLAHAQVDFVLCDREAMQPLAVILLATEEATDQEDTADKRAQLCKAAGLPVIRLERQNSYFMPQLTALIEPLLADNAARDDFSQDERMADALDTAGASPFYYVSKPKQLRNRPAYPGYGALRAIANKLS